MSGTKKSLGQHWLHYKGILDSIVETGEISENDAVLEIGPGKGTLTDVLNKTGAEVTALEFDQDLIMPLKIKFKGTNVSVVEGDIREFDYTSLPEGFKVIANIPYYLTSNLIRALSETENKPSVVVILIQKEVAERICASPGDMSVLAIAAQLHFECSLDVEVPAEYFTPPPKVDSQVVVMKSRKESIIDVDSKKFMRLIKISFAEKRKTLKNNISSGFNLDKEKVNEILSSAGLIETARAQELNFDEWFSVYSSLKSHLFM